MNAAFLQKLEEYENYRCVLTQIYNLTETGNAVIVAIDGRCGSGKTYLAELIGTFFPCNILHMDDFYLPFEQRPKNWQEIPAGNMDLERFLTEVLNPIRAGRQAVYRPYHCQKNCMGETIQLTPCNLTVAEGSYSHHPMLAAAYDLTIFLTCSKEEQSRRLRMREGERFPVFEKQWIPLEENYLRHCSIEANSQIVLDTSHFLEDRI